MQSEHHEIVKSKTKNAYLIFIFVLVLIPIIILGYIFFKGIYLADKYVLQTNDCGQEEKEAPIPNDLATRQFTFKEDLFYINPTLTYCTDYLKNAKKAITKSEERFSTPIAKNEVFTIEKTLLYRQYGLASIDSGSEWHKFFILKDSVGNSSYLDCFQLYQYLKLPRNKNCD